MKKHVIHYQTIPFMVLVLCCGFSSDLCAQTEIPAGNVSGTWTLANSPYHINGEITILNDSTLTIEPGVAVIFTGHYKFNVQGRLLAVGTQQDTINFTAIDTLAGWHGIQFINTPGTNDSSRIVYCSLKYGKANIGYNLNDLRGGGAICLIGDVKKLLISHCMFQYNLAYHSDVTKCGGGAIEIYNGASPVIEYCEFEDNTSSWAAAIEILGSSTALIRNNHFHNNYGKGTINIGSGATSILTNNLIENNFSNEYGNIVMFWGGGKAVLINNTIVNNFCAGAAAIFEKYDSDLLFINNIIYGNEPAQLLVDGLSKKMSFIHCLIEGGLDGFVGKDNFSGTYEKCLDANPQFVSADDFHLQDGSPCIGAGIDSIKTDSGLYYAPAFDFEGNPRPSEADPLVDIGAYESDYIASVFPLSFDISKSYIPVTSGTIHLTSDIFNYHNQNVRVFSKMYTSNGNSQDSVELFDDGQHGDGLTGDGSYGASYQSGTEDIFIPCLVIQNIDKGFSNEYGTDQKFTTIGPLVCKGYTIVTSGDTVFDPGETHRLKLVIQNNSQNITVTGIMARITSLDTFVTVVDNNFQFNDIPAGQITLSTSSRRVKFSENSPETITTVRFVVDISSDGYTFWRDTISGTFHVPVGIKSEKLKAPFACSLEQNYPNPFTTVTEIPLSLPYRAPVKLQVIDCLGRLVNELVNDELPPGQYRISFDATGLQGGIYYYQLITGDFAQTRKCMVVK